MDGITTDLRFFLLYIAGDILLTYLQQSINSEDAEDVVQQKIVAPISSTFREAHPLGACFSFLVPLLLSTWRVCG